ncbi:hypothetical protein F442_05519 [Phytophthora nicotianae P10297]|uniref:Proline-rich protein PRCC n=1 Tax=Phytophthora nicotianae P10297 TaxID=1317064 RepID=W2ZNH9_PHYNI|nr:hypothetical protein F442_05519 [Phytophthora nicotianae P10297]
MSLLVPDYASSSEDEAAPGVSAPTPPCAPALRPLPATKTLDSPVSSAREAAPKPKKAKTKVKKKKKTTLYLPPEIQRLLETGTSGGAFSDDSDDDNELLAKHKRAKKAANKRPRPSDTDKDSVLSFLPPPKHDLPQPDAVTTANVAVEERQTQEQMQEHAQQAAETQTGQQPVDEATAAANAAAWQQYYQQQQYQASYAASQDYSVAQGEEDVPGGSSKRRRTRERDIERALQQGHFETVADQITEVQGPAPNAWQPPVDPLTGASGAKGSSDQEMKLKASFWNSQAGTTVSSSKPSRLQRQKHQLNQLAFDAKARDFDLLEKRGASLKTKRETYAKYGW